MTSIKQNSTQTDICSASFLLNLLALFVMAYLTYKLKKTQKQLTDTTLELADNKIDNLWKMASVRPSLFSQKSPGFSAETPKDQREVRITFGKEQKPVLQAVKDQSKGQFETLMKEELELERQHSAYLQRENSKLKAQLDTRSSRYAVTEVIREKTESSKQSQEGSEKGTPISQSVTDLRNQLEFCQLRLKESELGEKELKARLHQYQIAAPFSLVHPEFYRLRELNQRYKEMINTLQRHLLERSSPPKIKISQSPESYKP